MKQLLFLCLLSFSLVANAQDIIYTVSAEHNQNKLPLDSILVENLTNEKRILFADLPEHDYYQINLTKNAFWGTVGINDISNDAPAFDVLSNTPGYLSIGYQRNIPTEIKISVFNVNGQLVYASTRQTLIAQNSVDVALGQSGIYFVRVEAPFGSQTFRAIGVDNINEYGIEISAKSTKTTTLKNGVSISEDDFSFTPGDSIRVSVYKNEYYARPIGMNINTSQDVDFVFDISEVVVSGRSDAYVELDDNTTNVTNYDSISGVVILDYTEDKPELKPGDVITVDVDTMGYLRKVIESTEDDGTITITTEQAYMNEVFVNKDFKLNTGMMNPGVQLKSTSSGTEISEALTDEDGYIHPYEVIFHGESGNIIKSALDGNITDDEGIVPLIDFYRDIATDLYGEEGDDVHFYIDEGHVSLTSNAVFEFDIKDEGELEEDTKVRKGDLNTFRFYLESEADFLTKLALDMSYSYEKEKEKKLIDLNKVTAKFFVGPVPVWITFDVDIFSYYNFNVDASLHSDWGFESNHTLQIGGMYEKQGNKFTPIKEYTPTNTIFPLNIEGEVNASARMEIYPRAEVKFYGFFGPYAEIVPYIQGNYNAAFQSQITPGGSETFLAWNSGIDLGLDFRVGTELSFLGIFSKEYGPEIINCFETPLWKSPTEISLVTTLPDNGEVGMVNTLKFQVTDLLGNPVSLCPVFIEGDGTFSKHILFTDINGETTVDWTLGETVGSNNFIASIYNADRSVIQEIEGDINVVALQPTVNTLNASEITETSATLNGEVTSDGGSTITERGFYWSSTNQTPDSNDNPTIVSGTTGSFSKNLSGLSPNTTYYYVAFAKNSKGESIGESKSFTTEESTNGDLLAYYPFNGNANDESGNGNDGTINGVTLTADRFDNPNSAYLFDGTDDYIDLNSALIPLSGNFTISLWINAASNYRDVFVSQYTYPGQKRCVWWIDEFGKLSFQMRLGDSTGEDFDSNISVSTNQWHHVAFVREGTTIKFILDNDEIETYSYSDGIIDFNTYLGARITPSAGVDPGDYFDGVIDDVRIYKIALTDNEISDLSTENGWTFETQTETGTFTDSRDGTEYDWVKIGDQTWMAENLAYNSGLGCYVYDNDENNLGNYGRLYNWETAMGGSSSSNSNPSGVKGACPSGWHLPSDSEWEQLAEFISNTEGPYSKNTDDWNEVGGHLKATSGWNDNGNGTNDFDFSGFPFGYRTPEGYFQNLGEDGFWWTATESDNSKALRRNLYYANDTFRRNYDDKEYSFSVRCIKD